MGLTHAIAELRHLYKQMIQSNHSPTQSMARGLLGRSIEELENAANAEDAHVDEILSLRKIQDQMSRITDADIATIRRMVKDRNDAEVTIKSLEARVVELEQANIDSKKK